MAADHADGRGFRPETCLGRICQVTGLAVQAQTELTVWFRGRPIGRFKADLIVDGAVLVELKCARAIEASHEAQVLNYLRATGLEIALLLNFGPKPAVRRFVFENTRKRSLNLRSSA